MHFFEIGKGMRKFSDVVNTSHTLHFATHFLEKSIDPLFWVISSIVLYYAHMEMKTQSSSFPPIIPANDETRAMLDYASSREGRAKIENARQEIRAGNGIAATRDFFANLSRRISERVARSRAARGA